MSLPCIRGGAVKAQPVDLPGVSIRPLRIPLHPLIPSADGDAVIASPCVGVVQHIAKIIGFEANSMCYTYGYLAR
jgi:hypothetical protein